MDQSRNLNFLERGKVRALEEDFANSLAKEHLASIDPERRQAVAASIYQQASEHLEARGYADVERHYRDFARIATGVYSLTAS